MVMLTHVHMYWDQLGILKGSPYSFRVYFILYWAFLGTAYSALHLAADLNATADQLVAYKDNGSTTLGLGIAAILLWFLIFFLDAADVCRYVSALGSIIGPICTWSASMLQINDFSI